MSRQWCTWLPVYSCAQTLMHVVANGGCSNTVRVSTESRLWERNSPNCTKKTNPSQYCAWIFRPTLYRLSYRDTVTRNHCGIQPGCQTVSQFGYRKQAVFVYLFLGIQHEFDIRIFSVQTKQRQHPHSSEADVVQKTDLSRSG